MLSLSGVSRLITAGHFANKLLRWMTWGSLIFIKIDLLKVMLMAQAAWAAVSADTIRNCWNHTGIDK
jgi:hypothetical protein